MKERKRLLAFTFIAAIALALAPCVPAGAQARPAAQSRPATPPAAQLQPPSDQDVADTQAAFLKLLRLSPVLTIVVARDPSLLADQQYVARNNPELAQFMASHPEIAQNPDFYLFSRLSEGRGHREQALERVVWPDLAQPQPQPSSTSEVMHSLIPIVVSVAFFIVLAWIIRIFVESRRWNRTFKLQSEVHGRLIDKFSSSQDLTAYMQTEAGRRFLEASPIAPGTDAGVRMPNIVARVLTPLQIGIVMALLGVGLLFLPRQNGEIANIVLGVLALMPGIGFILSAGATWIVAKRLGMLPDNDDNQAGTPPQLVSHDRP